jgi:hypothetical protein
VKFAGRTLTFDKLSEVRHGNYTAVEATVSLSDPTVNTKIFKPSGASTTSRGSKQRSRDRLDLEGRCLLHAGRLGTERDKVSAIQAIVNPLVTGSGRWTPADGGRGDRPVAADRTADDEVDLKCRRQRDSQSGSGLARVPLPA